MPRRLKKFNLKFNPARITNQQSLPQSQFKLLHLGPPLLISILLNPPQFLQLDVLYHIHSNQPTLPDDF